tara:strand:+ start:715 stop:1200 length:486 start_codon:yes stop_codon:yes gene_type:complete
MNLQQIAQLGRLAAMEKVGQRWISKLFQDVKPPKPPKVPGLKPKAAVPSGKSFKAPTKADLHMSIQGIGKEVPQFKDLEGLSPLARNHQKKQYDDLLKKYYDLTGQPGPVVMPGHPAFKYPDSVPYPSRPSRDGVVGPVVPGRKIQGTTPRQAAKKDKTSS